VQAPKWPKCRASRSLGQQAIDWIGSRSRATFPPEALRPPSTIICAALQQYFRDRGPAIAFASSVLWTFPPKLGGAFQGAPFMRGCGKRSQNLICRFQKQKAVTPAVLYCVGRSAISPS
jgi:hypothetical protein